MKFGDYQTASVTHSIKIDNVADWAKRPDVQAAFPEVKNLIGEEGKKTYKRTALKLTSKGWEAS